MLRFTSVVEVSTKAAFVSKGQFIFVEQQELELEVYPVEEGQVHDSFEVGAYLVEVE